MGKAKSRTRNRKHDASRRNTSKYIETSDVSPWRDFTHDVLYLVMMKLAGVIDFVSFSGVCKSWRALAIPNRKMFMASKPPMAVHILNHAYKKGCCCYFLDFEGRKFKTILPCFSSRMACVGLTCGYFVFYGQKTKDFWLANPITGHQLHFPNFYNIEITDRIKGILVFSPTISGWVFVMVQGYCTALWYSVAGEGSWHYVLSTSHILDIHAFKGKIYTLNYPGSLYEMRLNPKPKFTWLTEYEWKQQIYFPKFASLSENLYVSNNRLEDLCIDQLDFGQMKWVVPEEKTIREYVSFLSSLRRDVEIKPESWSQDKRYDGFNNIDISRKDRLYSTSMWYFPHLCLDVDILDEL